MRAIKTSDLPCPAYTVMVVVDLVRLFVIPQRAEGHIAPPVILRQHCTEESQRLHCPRSTFRAGCRFRAQLMFQWYSFGLCDLLCCASFGILYCVRCVHSLTVHGVRLHRCDDACCCMRCSQAVPQRYFGWMFSQQHTQRRQIKSLALSSSGFLMSTAGTENHCRRVRGNRSPRHIVPRLNHGKFTNFVFT